MFRPRLAAVAVALTAAMITAGTAGTAGCRDDAPQLEGAQLEHLANPALTPPAPARFEDPAAGFAVMAPGPAVVSRADLEARYRFPASGDGAYEVAAVALRLPAGGWAPFVAQTREALVRAVRGRLVSETARDRDGQPTVDLVLERPDGLWSHFRIVNADFGVFIASAAYPSGAAEARRHALAFLDSLTPRDPAASAPSAVAPDPGGAAGPVPGRFVDPALGLAFTPAGSVALVDTADARGVMVQRKMSTLELTRYDANHLVEVEGGDLCALHISRVAERLDGPAEAVVDAPFAGRPGRHARWSLPWPGAATDEQVNVEHLWCAPLAGGEVLTVAARGPVVEEAALVAFVATLAAADSESGSAVAGMVLRRSARPAGLAAGAARYGWPAPGPAVAFAGPVGARFELDPDSGYVGDGGLMTARLLGDDWEVVLLAVEVPEALSERVSASFADRFTAGLAQEGLAVKRTTGEDGSVLLSGEAGEGASTQARSMTRLTRLPSGWLLVRQRRFSDAEGQALTEAIADSVRALE